MRVNKYHIRWQVARVEAKAMSDVYDKVQHVTRFLMDFPNQYNAERALNWARASKMAYGPIQRMAFDNFLDWLKRNSVNWPMEDNDDSLSRIGTGDLGRVLTDLATRKYDFQFGGRVPKDHEQLVARIEMELATRVRS